MTADFDLNLTPIYRLKGQEIPQLPGLSAITPPRRAARGREEDELLIYLTISGNIPVASTEYNHVITQMAQQYYKTPGSLTAAVRAAADWLNGFLLKRNLGTTTKGQYVIGRLILGALKGSQCLFAQCGPTHIFQLTGAETRHVHDPQIGGHGLGISQSAPVYLAQVDLHANDLLLLCPDLAEGWETALTSERNLNPEMLHRRLLGISGDDLNAVLVQTRAGKGKLVILRGPRPSSRRVVPTVAPGLAAHPTAQVSSGEPANRFSRLISSQNAAPAQPTPAETTATVPGIAVPAGEPIAATSTAAEQVVQQPPRREPVKLQGRFISPRSAAELPEIQRAASRRRQSTFRFLARALRSVRLFFGKVGTGIRKFLPHLTPSPAETEERGSSGLALLAIVIPVVIVAIAATVYVQYGRTAQFQTNFAMAVNQADLARGQQDPIEVRRAWDSTIFYLDQAEKSLRNQPEAVALRQEAQTALDNLDSIIRLDFQPAIAGGLNRSVQVTQIAATETDLYLLDGVRGSVSHATLADRIYQVDSNFSCSPGVYDDIVVDKLVGIASLSMTNTYNAHVMGLDSRGTLFYCGVGDPTAVTLIQPSLGWNRIVGFTFDAFNNLYVLDSGNKTIWKYTGTNGEFTTPPTMFFAEQVPQNMESAISIAANNSDMYLLFQDGHVTSCPLTRPAGVPMRCADPATFADNRPERQPGTRITDAIFTQMTFASIPDTSLYMLEPLTHAVYRFSPRADSLELRAQFRATIQEELNESFSSGPSTALAIGPNRYIFMGVGSQVYYAADVP